MAQEDRRIEHLPLDDLVAAERNPKRHDLDRVRASIERFGFASPALRDERTGRLVVGHGRTQVLIRMRDEGRSPPAGIRADANGAWLVPVVCGWSSRSDAEAEAYLVADNRHTELGGWDHAELVALLESVGEADPELAELAGFTDEALAALEQAASSAPGPQDLPTVLGDPDEAPPLPESEPVSGPGDVWRLGPHRLLCGDATDVAAVEGMLAGERCDCMWTDPPYGVNYVGGNHNKPSTRRGGSSIANDTPEVLPELLAGAFAAATVALRPGAPFYIAHPAGPHSLTFMQAVLDAGWSHRQNLVWVKAALVMGRSDYHYRHEPIIYGFTAPADKQGRLGRGGPNWHGDDAQSSVFEYPYPQQSTEHPTMKPVGLVAAMLANSCPPEGLAYDPFGGSGSTLIAAHTTGRRARLVELDPRYVDVICRRWQEATGERPVHDATGVTADFVAAAAVD